MAIKLNAATGGGSVALDAPNATTSNADVVLTLPVDDGTSGQYLQTNGSGTLSWQTVASLSNAEDGTGTDFEFNSGFGSNATAYGVRAWIHFNGGDSSIGSGDESGNCSSITDNGSSGDYTFNFSNNMPDANYCIIGSVTYSSTWGGILFPYKDSGSPAAGSFRFKVANKDYTVVDAGDVMVGVVR